MNNDPQGPGGRWWEIRGAGQPDEDEGGYRELMTDSRGRSRPERSLSVGADLADEPHHPSHAFLWPIVSVVAAVGLILSVIYVVSTGKPKLPENALAAQPAVRSSAPGNAEAKPDVDAKPGGEAKPGGSGRPFVPPADGDTRPLTRSRADAPTGPALLPGSPTGNPAPVGTPSSNSGGAGGDSGNHSTGTSPPTTPAAPQDPPVKLDRPVPPAPSSARVRALKADTGGGCARSNDTYYVCTITREAPYYLPGTTEPSTHQHAGSLPLFRCQSDGPKYPGANGVNHWWAWLTPPTIMGISTAGWVPVVFLQGVPSGDKPVPGLPLCDGATESTGSASATPTPTSTAPPSARAPRTKSTGGADNLSDADVNGA